MSSRLSRTSAAVLATAGLLLLFAADEIMPRVVIGFPASAAWVAELAAAGYLGLAMLNWTSRSALLGGVYGRPIVLANALCYFVSAMTLLRTASGGVTAHALWPMAVGAAILAAAYGWLLFRGPFPGDLERLARGTDTRR